MEGDVNHGLHPWLGDGALSGLGSRMKFPWAMPMVKRCRPFRAGGNGYGMVGEIRVRFWRNSGTLKPCEPDAKEEQEEFWRQVGFFLVGYF